MIATLGIFILAAAFALLLWLGHRYEFEDSRTYIREDADWLGPIHWDWPR